MNLYLAELAFGIDRCDDRAAFAMQSGLLEAYDAYAIRAAS